MMDERTKKTLLFLVTEDHYFYSHRLPMARAAMKAGCDVAVITNVIDHREAIEAEGIRVIPLSLDRRSLNPFKALIHIARLIKIYRREAPVLVHHIAMKPVMYGGLAAILAGVPSMLNAFAGLGYLFTADSLKARVLRTGLTPIFKVVLKHKASHVLFQNRDDLDLLRRRGMLPDDNRVSIIRGSGVDLEKYSARSFPSMEAECICAFAGRMIGIKGLPTLKKAFEIVGREHPDIKLWLCGTPDPANPGSWTVDDLERWERNNANVVYKGYCNMADIWAQAHIALQPSYGGEGVPKALLEAAASGRAIVATDVPGCREVVEPGVNGYLVPSHDAEALAQAIIKIATKPEICRNMGRESRNLVASRGFSADSVARQTENLYKTLLSMQ